MDKLPEAELHFILMFFVLLLLLAILYRIFNGLPVLPRAKNDWGVPDNEDPRIAIAAMMYAVAVEDGPLTSDEERQILGLLTTTIRLEPGIARKCLAGGRKLSQRVTGDLNSRLHQLSMPIGRQCSPQEKQDVIDILHTVAGRTGESVMSVRDGLGRLSASLRNG